MKKIRLYFLCILLCRCGSVGDKNFIPGMYVREVHNEFSIGRDTLFIRRLNESSYSIIHSGIYQRIQDGKLMPVKVIHENRTAMYDDDQKILQETKRGRVFSFPSKNILMMDSSPYKKIK